MNIFSRLTASSPRLPMIYQAESSECSIACLSMVASYFGLAITIAELREMYPVSMMGLSLRSVLDVASKLGLNARPIRCDVDELPEIALPAMLHWDLEHFVVLKRISGAYYYIHDPGRGVMKLPRSELSKHMTGVVVEFNEPGELADVPSNRTLSLFSLAGSLKGFGSDLARILALSSALEAILLAQPLLVRYLVDNGIANKDNSLVIRLALVMGLIGILHGATSFLRDYVVLRAGTSLNLQMMQRLFRHALALPLSYFEKRPIGHLIERYRVADEIEKLAIGTLPLAAVDALMTLLSLCFVLYLSAKLGLTCIVTALIYFLFKVLVHRTTKSKTAALVSAKGDENGYLIETLKTIFTTKANAIEQNRYISWQGYYSRLIDAQRSFGILDLSVKGCKYIVSGVGFAVFCYFASIDLLSGILSIGGFFAALFYNTHFLARSSLFVDRLFEFLAFSVKLSRLEDMVTAQPETDERGMARGTSTTSKQDGKNFDVSTSLINQIILRGVSFSYSPADPLILNCTDLTLQPGEFVALIGANGAGKTTFLKLLLGLYRPTAGKIFFGGLEINEIPLHWLRSRIGVVTQEDQLYTGTVAENIALFDPTMNYEQVGRVAEIASIRAEIEALPMGFGTKVGDLGSPFSEGQKQRIFLARALYRNPQILIMDEGTANLDAENEAMVLSNLASISATKILIAHRSATIKRASKVVCLRGGKFCAVPHDLGTTE